MIIPPDPILYIYMLAISPLSLDAFQESYIDNVPKFNQPRPWYENKTLITNENIFNLNDIISKMIENN